MKISLSILFNKRSLLQYDLKKLHKSSTQIYVIAYTKFI